MGVTNFLAVTFEGKKDGFRVDIESKLFGPLPIRIHRTGIFTYNLSWFWILSDKL